MERIYVKDETGDRKYFTQIPNIVIAQGKPAEIGFYAAIKRYAGETGFCFLSINKLAKEMGSDWRTVDKMLERLCKYGWLKRADKMKVNGGAVQTFKMVDIWHENIKFFRKG